MIDPLRVKLARLEAGLTVQDLGKLLGISWSTVMGIEAGQYDHLPIRTAERLAHHLGVAPVDLTAQPDKGAGLSEGPSAAADGVELEVLLFTRRRQLPKALIGELKGWSGTRLMIAISALHGQLAGRGVGLREANGTLSLVPRLQTRSADAVQRAERHLHTRTNLNWISARALYTGCFPVGRAYHSKNQQQRNHFNSVASLLRAGLLKVGEGGGLGASDDVAFSLKPALEAMSDLGYTTPGLSDRPDGSVHEQSDEWIDEALQAFGPDGPSVAGRPVRSSTPNPLHEQPGAGSDGGMHVRHGFPPAGPCSSGGGSPVEAMRSVRSQRLSSDLPYFNARVRAVKSRDGANYERAVRTVLAEWEAATPTEAEKLISRAAEPSLLKLALEHQTTRTR